VLSVICIVKFTIHMTDSTTYELVCNVHRLLYDTLVDLSTKEAMYTIYLVINLPWCCMLAFLFAAPCSSDGARDPFGPDGGRDPLGQNCKFPPNIAQVNMV